MIRALKELAAGTVLVPCAIAEEEEMYVCWLDIRACGAAVYVRIVVSPVLNVYSGKQRASLRY